MWAKAQKWQISQLERLVSSDPDRAETILNTVWKSFPGLLSELAISAVDQEMISVQECAEVIGSSEEEVVQRLINYRRRPSIAEATSEVHSDNAVAKVADGRIAVWEVIREHRKLGSVDRLRQAFPSISEPDLAYAFRYAESHQPEIEKLIRDYEDILAKRRAEYPFAK